MGRVGRAVGVDGVVGVAVVGDLDDFVAVVARGVDDGACAGVDGDDGLFNRVVDARVAHHVAVGEVEADEVVLLGGNGLDELFGDLGGAHLGLQVVGRDRGTRHEDAVLAFIRGFAAAVEEERDVGVLFGLGDAQLPEALGGDPFTDRVDDVLLREEDVQALVGRVVGRHRAEVERQGLHFEIGSGLLREHGRELLGAVVAEVHEDDGVVRADAAHGNAVSVREVLRLEELVGDALAVGDAHGVGHVGDGIAHALDEQVVGAAHALPALVAVHGPVAAHEAHEFARSVGLRHFGEHVLHEAFAALGIGVAAVKEAVHVDLLEARSLRKAQERVHVAVEAVHAAVGEKAHDVQGAALFAAVVDEGLHLGIVADRAVGDRAVDLDEILVEDAAGADVEVAHFGVAHLAVGQAHVFAVGAQFGVRILRRKLAEALRPDAADHVGPVAAADAPAVENHEQNLLACTGRHRLVSFFLNPCRWCLLGEPCGAYSSSCGSRTSTGVSLSACSTSRSSTDSTNSLTDWPRLAAA